MQGEVFTYLERKLENEYQDCGWDDDISREFQQKHFERMKDAVHDLSDLEEKIKELEEEVNRKLRYR